MEYQKNLVFINIIQSLALIFNLIILLLFKIIYFNFNYFIIHFFINILKF